MKHWHTTAIFLLVSAPLYVLHSYIPTAEACLLKRRTLASTPNSLLTYTQSFVEQDDWYNTHAPLATTHDIHDVFIGYVRQCQSSNNNNSNIRLISRKTAFGYGLVLYPDPVRDATVVHDKPALEPPCVASSKSKKQSTKNQDQFCQVWTNKKIWQRLSKVQLDIVNEEDEDEVPELLDGWEVADRYGYDAPPVLAWRDVRFIPRHLIRRDLDVTGGMEVVYDSPISKYLVADDGGIRLGQGKDKVPLFQLVCPHQHQKTGSSQISNVVEWDDAESETFRSAAALASRRIVAIGDLHGDFANTLNVYRMANIIDEHNHWAGGNHTIFVQTGDIVDRGHDTILLYEFMRVLKTEAYKAGGRVVQVLGNHEIMNMAEDLRFVTAEDYMSFGGPEPRKLAFSQKGEIGRRLYQLHLVHRVGDTVFAHGGINEEWAGRGVRLTNRDTTRELPPYVAETDIYRRYYGWPIFGDNGPAWYRGYAEGAEHVICRSLYKSLKKMKVKRMVVGHTWQASGRILPRCNNRFFVIDVGISFAYGRYQAALEIAPNGKVTGIYPDNPVEFISASSSDA